MNSASFKASLQILLYIVTYAFLVPLCIIYRNRIKFKLNKMLVFRAGIHKNACQKCKQERFDQTASDLVLHCCLGLFDRQLML